MNHYVLSRKELKKISDERQKFAALQLEQGTINQTDYNAEIDSINNDNREANEIAQSKRNEAEKERQTVELANKRLLENENFETELELKLAELERSREQEISEAEKTGASLESINKRYAIQKNKLEKESADAKTETNKAVLGEIASLLGEETTIGKVAALAQAGINIQQGITKALAVGGIAGIVQGTIVAAKGAQSIAKITGIGTKFERGGFQEVGGKRHSQGGTKFIGEDGTGLEVEKGEGIGVFSRDEFAALRQQNNASLAGTGSASNVTQFVSQTNSLGAAEIRNIVTATVAAMPQPIVAVEDILYQSNSYVEVKTGADL